MHQEVQLIERCSRRERAAQKELYDTYADTMFKTCLRYSTSNEEAEDTLQDGFIKIFDALHQFKFNGSFEGWMRKIMINTALQKIRSKNYMHAVIDIDSVKIESAESEEIISRIGTKDLMKMIQLLPPSYRAVFNLYVFEGYKHKEIAQELGISEGTSKSNLFDARLILQRYIAKSLLVATQKGQTI